ncbi:hypothetical protein BDA99DRAFT_523520 [Phascolomyces articulosus]|uniref:Uncharacterized protein n=1 Tax=Phascolomyces articulosus TaxID=60185 RepID=A0AAD5K410_9FUNG|nr:hypothetical protein BDA99DRAFT_523520 [Phascolomyces articulosus]
MSTVNVLEPATLNRLNPSSDMVFVAAVTVGDSRSYYFRQNLNTTPSSSPKYNAPKQIIPSVPRQRIKAPNNSFLSPIRSEKTPPRRHSNSSAALPPPRPPPSQLSPLGRRSSPLMASPLLSIQRQRKRDPAPEPSLSLQQQQQESQQPQQTQAVQKLKRPYPLIHAISSPTLLFPLKMNRRRRKVSFSEHVVVVRTIIHTDEDDIDEEEDENDKLKRQEEDDESCIYGWRRHSTGSAPTPSDDIENNEIAKQRILGVSKSLKRFVF